MSNTKPSRRSTWQPRMDVTYSMFRSFQTCPRKCYWQYIQKLESAKKSDALDIGTMFHKLIEDHYTDTPTDGLMEATSIYNIATMNEREQENLAKATSMAMAYANVIGCEFDKRYHYCASEQVFSMPLSTSTGGVSRTFTLTGKIDGMVIDRQTGERWLVEHKTAAKVYGQYLDKLSLDLQIMIYMIAGRLLYPDTPPVGVIYNIVQKSTLKRYEVCKKRSEPEPLYEYQARMDAQYEANPSMVSQHQIHFSQRDLNDVAVELGMWADHITMCRKSDQWPRNTGSCQTVYGTCQFWPLCQGNQLDADMYMGTLYQKKDNMHSELSNDTANDINDLDNLVF